MESYCQQQFLSDKSTAFAFRQNFSFCILATQNIWQMGVISHDLVRAKSKR